jgi:site-specific DNA-cytosine methylase
VWENVPGAFSSAKGEDFRAVLAEIVRRGCKCTADLALAADVVYDMMRWV